MYIREILILEDGDFENKIPDRLKHIVIEDFKICTKDLHKNVIIIYRGVRGIKVFKDAYNITGE